jgi:hypothetical protein
MRRIRFTHKRNRGCWGKAFVDEFRVELDPAMESKTELEIGIHEGLHCLFPYLPEQEVDTAGKTLADLLWRLGYRRKDDE